MLSRKFKLIVTLVGLSLSAASLAAPVEVVGLFKDRAVIRVPGGERLIKVGEVSPEGVRLVSADAREAVIEYNGERHTLSLTSRVSGSYAALENTRVSIPADDLGQYRIRGAINNQYVDFLVDTGASVIALSASAAQSLGIDYLRGQRGSVQTAQGNAESYFLTLDRVTVSGITAHNVQAAVISGQYPREILLGMSFLRQVSMEENGGVMTLIQKFQ